MVLKEEFLAALKQAVELSADEVEHQRDHAGEIVSYNKINGLAPLSGVGGREREHLAGKLCEIAFLRYCTEHDVPLESGPFRPYDREESKADFMLAGHSIDIKSGIVTFDDATTIRIDGFGLQVPQYQIDKHLSEYYVYCWLDLEAAKVGLIGWCEGVVVKNGIEMKALRPSCRRVPILQLRPMPDLFSSITTKQMSQSSRIEKVKV